MMKNYKVTNSESNENYSTTVGLCPLDLDLMRLTPSKLDCNVNHITNTKSST